MLKVQIIIFDGFDELDGIAPYEVLKVAAANGADMQVELVALDPNAVITASHGSQVHPQAQFTNEAEIDILIVPGGGWGEYEGEEPPPAGVRAELQGKIPQIIYDLYQKGVTIASVCTGAMLVAEKELLSGRPAITHHNAIKDLEDKGAVIIKARVVDDGDIITAGGVTSGLDLALWLVERYFTPEIADKTETLLEYERRGTVWRRSA
ncbi:DJ-1/PfpI family protein [Microseira wollei]|uniref:ThiJ/PfpI domain protein n=1 Tax=Microseira wollei NIES-4236 TaxID=2530354 RepID=A0AAV3XDM4_9CYAN|nr:DJ-1/PfpI family protein [Microseira wollei]GET38200.1 ThiJ/PfpI domain protein [Microseira wollei NIES-4236]